MQYKTELHMHTAEVSVCAKLTAPEMVERYLDAGYHTVVITNHYSPTTVAAMGDGWSTERYLSAYHIMKEYAKGRLNVLLGAELRFEGSPNDYLLYGLTEEFLYAHPNLHEMTLETFYPIARENGILVIQAHPFRKGMCISRTEALDGIEVYNVSELPFRNHIALEWAKHYDMIGTSGSDLHDAKNIIGCGLLTDTPVESVEQLVAILKSRTATLMRRSTDLSRPDLGDIPATLQV
jgi:hypothetical protein